MENKETVFRNGDRVYDVSYGFGIVSIINDRGDYSIRVKFENLETECYTYDGRLYTYTAPCLSFTEYSLENGGFSQERPVFELKNIGDLRIKSSNKFMSEIKVINSSFYNSILVTIKHGDIIADCYLDDRDIRVLINTLKEALRDDY